MTDLQARRSFILRRRKSGATFTAIGKELGISTSRVSQLHAAALTAAERAPQEVNVTQDTRLCDLPLSWRTREILAQVPELTVADYLAISEPDRPAHMLRLPRFGRRELNELEKFLLFDEAAIGRTRI